MKSLDKKKLNILVIIGGVLMIILNLSLITLEGSKFSNYIGIFAGLAFALSGIYGLKKKKQENL